jgi:hypothetical protein
MRAHQLVLGRQLLFELVFATRIRILFFNQLVLARLVI